MMQVSWQKNTQNNEWFDFLRLDLDAPYFNEKRGVFLIWYIGSPGRVIKVGSGNLSEQLKNLRSNPSVIDFSKNGPLKVSWVAVNGVLKEDQMLGVQAFLYNTYAPILGEKTESLPIDVNILN